MTENLSKIVIGIEAEIKKALNIYCTKDIHLSKVYWPRPFRNLISKILKFIIQKPELWNDLSTPKTNIDHQYLEKLIIEINLSTSSYIKVIQRESIYHILRQMSFRKIPRSQIDRSVESKTEWPHDIEDQKDLLDSLVDVSMRSDVKKCLWKIIDDVIPADKSVSLHFFGALKSTLNTLPIRIDVAEQFVDILQDQITSVSSHLMALGHENLLPDALVEIKGVPDREVVVPIEEGFHTSGSPWKTGTMGAIMKCGNNYFGLTSGHVDRTGDGDYVQFYADDYDPQLNRIIQDDCDVAFVKFRDGIENIDRLFNLYQMQFIEDLQSIQLTSDEDVYKIGVSTGITVGKLESPATSYRTSGRHFNDHVKVRWNDDNCRFAFSMDCGSLYCVKRGSTYHPIAIHRISDENSSYGCSIWRAMSYFPIDDSPVYFVNAPYLRLQPNDET